MAKKPAPISEGEIITADRKGTNGKPLDGAEMEHDYIDTDGNTKTFSSFVSTRHNKNAISEKLRDGWRICGTAPAATSAPEEPAQPADGEVANG